MIQAEALAVDEINFTLSDIKKFNKLNEIHRKLHAEKKALCNEQQAMYKEGSKLKFSKKTVEAQAGVGEYDYYLTEIENELALF